MGLEKALTLFLDKVGEYELDGFIFTSRKGDNKPITRQRAWQVINEVAQSAGIKDEMDRLH